MVCQYRYEAGQRPLPPFADWLRETLRARRDNP
jgi:hypothetical protein